MRKRVSLFLIFILTVCIAVFLCSCGCSDDGLGIFSGMFEDEDEELVESVMNGSAYEAYENGELDDDYDYSSLPEGVTIMSFDNISEEKLNGLIIEGRDVLINESETDRSWTERWYTGSGESGLYRILESVDYVGSYLFADTAGYSEYELYLVYDVHVIQAGKSDKQNVDYIGSEQTELEYYWYVSCTASADYNTGILNFSSVFAECSHAITFDTYSLGGFNMINTISKSYNGYRSVEDLYDGLIAETGDDYVLSDSTI